MAGKQRPRWVRLSGLGMELAAAVAGCSLLGYWIDHSQGSLPWGTLIGFAIGMTGGMYNFVRTSKRAFEESSEEGDADERS